MLVSPAPRGRRLRPIKELVVGGGDRCLTATV